MEEQTLSGELVRFVVQHPSGTKREVRAIENATYKEALRMVNASDNFDIFNIYLTLANGSHELVTNIDSTIDYERVTKLETSVQGLPVGAKVVAIVFVPKKSDGGNEIKPLQKSAIPFLSLDSLEAVYIALGGSVEHYVAPKDMIGFINNKFGTNTTIHVALDSSVSLNDYKVRALYVLKSKVTTLAALNGKITAKLRNLSDSIGKVEDNLVLSHKVTKLIFEFSNLVDSLDSSVSSNEDSDEDECDDEDGDEDDYSDEDISDDYYISPEEEEQNRREDELFRRLQGRR